MNKTDMNWLIDLVPDAVLVVGRDQIIMAANTRADALFGAAEGALSGMPLEVLIPESIRQAHQRHVDGFFSSQGECRAMGSSLRLYGRRLDGKTLPVDIMLNRIDLNNQSLTMAVIRDDSERVAVQQMRDDLRSTNARLSRAQEVGGLGWWEFNCSTETLSWSQMVPRILGLPENTEPSLSRVAEQCHESDREPLLALHDNLITAPGQRLTYRINQPGGELRWIQETIDYGPDNRVLGVMRDITVEKELEQRLRRESVIDDLTGLYNRKQFNRDLNSRYSDYVRHGHQVSVIMYDFDFFKRINDHYGHGMGDTVLKESAQLVTDKLRQSDRAYRLGGEEFAIILGHTESGDVEKLAERVRHTIQEACFNWNQLLLANVTISLGVSQFRPSDRDFEGVFRRADEALYRSKSASRNTVSVFD